MTNFVEEANYFDIINSNESESDLTEEDYWYSVEQDRYKEQLGEEQLEEELRDYEDSEEKRILQVLLWGSKRRKHVKERT